MDQITRRALFGLGIGAIAVPVIKLLPQVERTDDVLPTRMSPKEFQRLREANLISKGWVQRKVQVYRVGYDRLTQEVTLEPK